MLDFQSTFRGLYHAGFNPVLQFSRGNSGASVLLVNSNKNKKVIKVPTNQRSLDEIVSNIAAYSQIVDLGIRAILPPYLEIKEVRGLPYTAMSYLGEDFATIADSGVSSEKLYDQLCTQLEKIYKQTKRQNNQRQDFLIFAKNKILDNFWRYLIPAGLSNSKYIGKIGGIKSFSYNPVTCFAPYDFTPEDIFVWENGIFYPDPKNPLMGFPQISLACFSGVARDVYRLHGSDTGYKIIREFAIKECSNIMEISTDTAEELFLLGRVLQCSLSSKVRIGNDKEKARYFAKESEKFLELL